jgi:hypothetical protein
MNHEQSAPHPLVGFEKARNGPSSIRVLFRNFRVGNLEVGRCVEPLITRVEWGPLARLRNGALVVLDGGLEDIDFRGGPTHKRAVTVLRSRVVLIGTCASREPLTWKVRKGVLVVLVAREGGDIR